MVGWAHSSDICELGKLGAFFSQGILIFLARGITGSVHRCPGSLLITDTVKQCVPMKVSPTCNKASERGCTGCVYLLQVSNLCIAAQSASTMFACSCRSKARKVPAGRDLGIHSLMPSWFKAPALERKYIAFSRRSARWHGRLSHC